MLSTKDMGRLTPANPYFDACQRAQAHQRRRRTCIVIEINRHGGGCARCSKPPGLAIRWLLLALFVALFSMPITDGGELRGTGSSTSVFLSDASDAQAATVGNLSLADMDRMLQRKRGESLRGLAGRIKLLKSSEFQQRLGLTVDQQTQIERVLDSVVPDPDRLRSLIPTGVDVSQLRKADAQRLLGGFVSDQRRRVKDAEDLFQVLLTPAQYQFLLGTQASQLGPASLMDDRIQEFCDVDPSQLVQFAAQTSELRREAKQVASATGLDVRSMVRLFESLEKLDDQLLRDLKPEQLSSWERLEQAGDGDFALQP